MIDEKKLEQARQKVEAIKGFYIHVVVFFLVITLLFAIDASAGGAWWVQWVILFWGGGLALHATLVYSDVSNFSRDWEQRKIKEILDADRAKE